MNLGGILLIMVGEVSFGGCRVGIWAIWQIWRVEVFWAVYG